MGGALRLLLPSSDYGFFCFPVPSVMSPFVAVHHRDRGTFLTLLATVHLVGSGT